jgi:hypothetical protein
MYGASDSGGVDSPLESNSTVDDATGNPDPFVFDDVGEQIGELRLPFADSDGPNF